MKQKTADLIRMMLTQRISDLLRNANHPAASPELLVQLEDASAAFLDFCRSGMTPDDTSNVAAFTALDALTKGRAHLDELDAFFEKGTGKGSRPHQFIKRLVAITDIHPDEPEVLTDPAPTND